MLFLTENELCFDRVKEVIRDKDEFRVFDKGDFIVVDYLYMYRNTFVGNDEIETAILRDTRGIIFHRDGTLAARRFHKFFNIGETEFTKPDVIADRLSDGRYHVMEKLDGSMISPLFDKSGNLVHWASMCMSEEFDRHVKDYVVPFHERNGERVVDFCNELYHMSLLPIFEIVVGKNTKLSTRYPIMGDHEDHLVLTAIRDQKNGTYVDVDVMRDMASDYNLRVVGFRQNSIDNLDRFLAETSDLENIEGFVIRFNDGEMVKIKTKWYITASMVINDLGEMNILSSILDGKEDDIVGILTQVGMVERARNLLRYRDHVHERVSEFEKIVRDEMARFDMNDRKTSYMSLRDRHPDLVGYIMASMKKGALEVFREKVTQKHAGKREDAMRLFGIQPFSEFCKTQATM